MQMSQGEEMLVRLVREGFLEVRPDGTVWRLMRRTRKGALLRIEPVRADFAHTAGYRSVRVQVDGVCFFTQAHRLIWIVAHGPIPPDIEVNHEDGVRSHNWLGNLNLLTHGGNMKHSYDKLGHARCRGERNGASKLTAAQADEVARAKGRASSRVVGQQFGISHRQVLNIWNGHNWGAAA